jgi:hypothetical protein
VTITTLPGCSDATNRGAEGLNAQRGARGLSGLAVVEEEVRILKVAADAVAYKVDQELILSADNPLELPREEALHRGDRGLAVEEQAHLIKVGLLLERQGEACGLGARAGQGEGRAEPGVGADADDHGHPARRGLLGEGVVRHVGPDRHRGAGDPEDERGACDRRELHQGPPRA